MHQYHYLYKEQALHDTASLGIFTQEGLFKTFEDEYNSNFKYNRYNYRINLDMNITKSTTLRMNVGGRVNDKRTPNADESLNSFFQTLYWAVPFAGAGLVDGKWLKADTKKIANMSAEFKDGMGNGALSVAIVGYTNAGKSTLMNKLTDAGVLQEDKLFATLDPTARKLSLPNGQSIMLIDTVGFISRLPHQLVDAFRSTLEEATYADVILNVCDTSSPYCYDNIDVTKEILSSLFPDGAITVPVITVFNKCDITHSPSAIAFPFADAKTSVKISAKTGEGLDELLLAIQNALPQTKKRLKLLVPFSKGSILADIRQDGVIHSEEYTPDGTLIDATVDIIYLEKNKQYIKIIDESV